MAAAVHLTLICGQILMGSGAVVGKLGLHGANPVLFCLVRECVAGPLLLLLSTCLSRAKVLPPREDACRLVAAGFALMANQIFTVIGLKLASPLTASAWQPSQPMFALALAAFLGQETFTVRKALGILLAVCGACFMVLWGASDDPASGSSVAGHACFFVNCFMTACFIIITKPLLRRHAALSVQAWSYLLGSGMVMVIAIVVSRNPQLLQAVCRDKDETVQQRCIDGAWTVPSSMVLPLAYWIVFVSMVGYYCMVWATQHTNPSTVSVYTVLQPATSALISIALIITFGSSFAHSYGLTYPGVQDLGILGIIVGLLVLFSGNSGTDRSTCSGTGSISDGRTVASQDPQEPLVVSGA